MREQMRPRDLVHESHSLHADDAALEETALAEVVRLVEAIEDFTRTTHDVFAWELDGTVVGWVEAGSRDRLLEEGLIAPWRQQLSRLRNSLIAACPSIAASLRVSLALSSSDRIIRTGGHGLLRRLGRTHGVSSEWQRAGTRGLRTGTPAFPEEVGSRAGRMLGVRRRCGAHSSTIRPDVLVPRDLFRFRLPAQSGEACQPVGFPSIDAPGLRGARPVSQLTCRLEYIDRFIPYKVGATSMVGIVFAGSYDRQADLAASRDPSPAWTAPCRTPTADPPRISQPAERLAGPAAAPPRSVARQRPPIAVSRFHHLRHGRTVAECAGDEVLSSAWHRGSGCGRRRAAPKTRRHGGRTAPGAAAAGPPRLTLWREVRGGVRVHSVRTL